MALYKYSVLPYGLQRLNAHYAKLANGSASVISQSQLLAKFNAISSLDKYLKTCRCEVSA
jgi:hypothetical protein